MRTGLKNVCCGQMRARVSRSRFIVFFYLSSTGLGASMINKYKNCELYHTFLDKAFQLPSLFLE